MFSKFVFFLSFFSFSLGAELPKNFFTELPSASKNKFIGKISITDRTNGINESTWLYVKAALEEFKETKPLCIILELDTPGGELFAAEKISSALKKFDAEEGIPVIAYINNWAVSAGALLAYSCRYIVITTDATMGAATPIYQKDEKMKKAPEKVNSVVRAEFANKAALFGRNQEIARSMVDPDIILVQRGDTILSLHHESDIQKTGSLPDIVLSPKGKLLTLTAQEMVKFHVADHLVSKPIEKYAKASFLPIKTFEMTTKGKIVAFLASPAITSLLVFVAMVMFYIEFSTPGVSIPGLIGGIALFLVLVGSFAQEAITLFEPLCLAAGIALICVEIFLFPTLGILLFIGGGLALFGFLGLIIPGLAEISLQPESLSLFGGYIINRLGWLSGAFLMGLLAVIFIARFLTAKSLHLPGIVLQGSMPTPVETVGVEVGGRAKVVAPLRPAGKIVCRGAVIDALSRGDFIEEKEEVRIIELRGNIVIVEKVGP